MRQICHSLLLGFEELRTVCEELGEREERVDYICMTEEMMVETGGNPRCISLFLLPAFLRPSLPSPPLPPQYGDVKGYMKTP